MLENFTLGLKDEKHWPAGAGGGTSVEGWHGLLDDKLMVTIFYGDYRHPGSPGTAHSRYFITIRKIPRGGPVTHNDWFSNSTCLYRGYIEHLDPLLVKCLCLEHEYLEEEKI